MTVKTVTVIICRNCDWTPDLTRRMAPDGDEDKGQAAEHCKQFGHVVVSATRPA